MGDEAEAEDPVLSFIVIREVQPRIHPDGKDGSSDTGVMGTSLKLH